MTENNELVVEYLLQKIKDLSHENAVLSARIASMIGLQVANDSEEVIIGESVLE